MATGKTYAAETTRAVGERERWKTHGQEKGGRGNRQEASNNPVGRKKERPWTVPAVQKSLVWLEVPIQLAAVFR